MIGDTVTADGETYEVVWSGGEGLLQDRETEPSAFWEPPKRIYHNPESRKPPVRFGPGEIERVLAFVNTGKTFREIGKFFGVRGETVSRIIRKNRPLDKVDKLDETPDNRLIEEKC